MIKVYQNEYNCLQSCIASLLETSIDNIIDVTKEEYRYEWKDNLRKFLDKIGYTFKVFKPSDKLEKGFYIGVVKSKLITGTHAIIINEELNIIHDPNPDEIYFIDFNSNNIIELYEISKKLH